MFENLTKSRLYSLLTGTFCALIIMSNILGTKTIKFEWIMLPCSILTFPALFIINDNSIIFISVAFLCVFSLDLIATMICCQVLFKSIYELISYPATRKVIFAIRNIDDDELKG